MNDNKYGKYRNNVVVYRSNGVTFKPLKGYTPRESLVSLPVAIGLATSALILAITLGGILAIYLR